MTIESTIAELVEAGKTVTFIRASLVVAGYKPKDISEAIKAANLSRSRGTGFRAQFYLWLQEGVVTEDEAKSFIEAHGTGNDIKHTGHYLAIAELANAIHDQA